MRLCRCVLDALSSVGYDCESGASRALYVNALWNFNGNFCLHTSWTRFCSHFSVCYLSFSSSLCVSLAFAFWKLLSYCHCCKMIHIILIWYVYAQQTHYHHFGSIARHVDCKWWWAFAPAEYFIRYLTWFFHT